MLTIGHISEVLVMTVRLCPLVFGVADKTMGLNTTQSDIITFTSLLAHRRILLVCKSSTPPSAAAWLEDVMGF